MSLYIFGKISSPHWFSGSAGELQETTQLGYIGLFNLPSYVSVKYTAAAFRWASPVGWCGNPVAELGVGGCPV